MLLLGHIGITAFVSSMLFLPAIGAVAGVLLPDLIDKVLFQIGYAPCSRFIAHSIFFPPVAGLVAYALTRNKKFAIAIALGASLHLVEDLQGDIPLLYPLRLYAFFDTCGPIHVEFTPYFIITETIGGALMIFVFGFRKKFVSIRAKFWSIFHRVLSWKKK